MLITDKFVMLNFPKTGSSFARNTLKLLHQPGRLRRACERRGLVAPALQELLMKPYFFTVQHAATGRLHSEHGVYHQIPGPHRAKSLFTVVRDPLQRLVSLYEFRSWAKYPVPDREQVARWYPQFPDLSFEDFFRLNQELILPFIQPPGMQIRVGPLTTQFIRFYAHNPLKTILSLREGTDLQKDYDLHFPRIRFLHTENLNQEMHDLLLQFGYPARKIKFILDKERMNTTARSRSTYWTPELVNAIHENERFFFQLFPEYLNDGA